MELIIMANGAIWSSFDLDLLRRKQTKSVGTQPFDDLDHILELHYYDPAKSIDSEVTRVHTNESFCIHGYPIATKKVNSSNPISKPAISICATDPQQ